MKRRGVISWSAGLAAVLSVVFTAQLAHAGTIPVHDPNCTSELATASSVTGAQGCFYVKYDYDSSSSYGKPSITTDSYVKDTATDGMAARAWIRYEYLESGTWKQATVALGTTSPGEPITNFGWSSPNQQVRNLDVRVCNGIDEKQCDHWEQ